MNTKSFKPVGLSCYKFLIFKNILLVTFIIFSLNSCQESLVNPVKTVEVDSRILPRTTAADTLDYFVKALTKAQSDVDIRTFIKNAALNNRWDDNALVYAMEKDVVVKNSLTFAQILYNSRDQSDTRFGSSFFSSDIFVEYPTISIYLYTGDEDLDVSDFTTSSLKGVFQIPDDHSAIDSIQVYKWNTTYTVPVVTSFKIGSLAEPTQQYFCVGPSSTLIAIETIHFNLYPGGLSLRSRMGFPPLCEELTDALINNSPVTLTINGVDVILIDQATILGLWCELCDDGSSLICNNGGEGGDPCLLVCQRDCRDDRDQLVKYHFNYQSDLDATCSWTRRWCSFTIYAVYATGPNLPIVSNLLKTDRARRYDLKGWHGRWWTPDSDILFLKWDLNIHADPIKYSWIYLNPKAGQERTATIGFSGKFTPPGQPETGISGSTTLKYTKKDKLLYEDVNYYCDQADDDGTSCNTGSVTFYIKERQ